MYKTLYDALQLVKVKSIADMNCMCPQDSKTNNSVVFAPMKVSEE